MNRLYPYDLVFDPPVAARPLRAARPGIRGLAWIVALWAAAALGPWAGATPNVVFIMADDLGWGDLRVYGNSQVQTPVLDRLADEGRLFLHAYSAAAVGSPSRAGILTGAHPARAGIHADFGTPEAEADTGMPGALPHNPPMLARTLKQQGYRTGHFGRWHLGETDARLYGYEEARTLAGGGSQNAYDPAAFGGEIGLLRQSSEQITDDAIDFIQRHRHDRFFLQVWYHEPHGPNLPNEPFLDWYPAADGVPQQWLIQDPLIAYHAVVSNLDYHIGRLLDELDALGLGGNTLVVFASDNGPADHHASDVDNLLGMGSAGPFRGRKRSLYEGGIRIPFIARWPGTVPAGTVDSTNIVSLLDLFPTFAALAGANVSGLGLEGRDIRPALDGNSITRNQPLFWEWRHAGARYTINRSPTHAARLDRWKFLMNHDQTREELYDLLADPMEVDNRVEEYPQVAADLKQALLQWRAGLPAWSGSPEAGQHQYAWPEPQEGGYVIPAVDARALDSFDRADYGSESVPLAALAVSGGTGWPAGSLWTGDSRVTFAFGQNLSYWAFGYRDVGEEAGGALTMNAAANVDVTRRFAPGTVAGPVVWTSFLVNRQSVNSVLDRSGITLIDGDGNALYIGSRAAGFGLGSTVGILDLAESPGVFGGNETHLVLARIDLGGGRADAWLNPPDVTSQTSLGTPDVSAAIPHQVLDGRVFARFGENGTPRITFDSFRLAWGEDAEAVLSAVVRPRKGIPAPFFAVAGPLEESRAAIGRTYLRALEIHLADGVEPLRMEFEKISGPAWLEVSADGLLSGSPPAGASGMNRFTVRVRNAAGYIHTIELAILVGSPSEQPPPAPKIRIHGSETWIHLIWDDLEIDDLSHYEVWRSEDLVDFEPVAGPFWRAESYQENVMGSDRAFYRIRAVDTSGNLSR